MHLVRIGVRCHFCKKKISDRSSIGTSYLDHYRERCKHLHGRSEHQSMLKYYSLEIAREKLCCLIARTDLSLCFGASDAFEEYIKISHNPMHSNISRQTTTRDMKKYLQCHRTEIVELLNFFSRTHMRDAYICIKKKVNLSRQVQTARRKKKEHTHRRKNSKPDSKEATTPLTS